MTDAERANMTYHKNVREQLQEHDALRARNAANLLASVRRHRFPELIKLLERAANGVPLDRLIAEIKSAANGCELTDVVVAWLGDRVSTKAQALREVDDLLRLLNGESVADLDVELDLLVAQHKIAVREYATRAKAIIRRQAELRKAEADIRQRRGLIAEVDRLLVPENCDRFENLRPTTEDSE